MPFDIVAFPSTSQQMLLAARELIIEPQRWGKYSLWRGLPEAPTSYCLLGAILYASLPAKDIVLHGALAMSFRPHMGKTINLIHRIVRELYHCDDAWAPRAIIKFNDRPRTQHDDVIRVLNTAIEGPPPLAL